MTTTRTLVVMLAIVLTAGCGLIQRDGQAPRDRHDGSVSRSYPAKTTRVALAVFGSFLPEIKPGGFDFSIDKETSFSVDPKSKPSAESLKIDELVCNWVEVTGTTMDGRPIGIELWARKLVEETTVTIRVGKSGDEALSKIILDRIADRLAHPEHAPGSPEENRQIERMLGLDKAEIKADFKVPKPAPIR